MTMREEPAEVDAGPPTDAIKGRRRRVGVKGKEKESQSSSSWSAQISDKAIGEKSPLDLLLDSAQPDSQSASTREEESHAKRYVTRRRHTSGSSLVEQLTQNYMARKEQLGSPASSPVPARRLRVRKGEVEGPVLESTADSDGELAVKRVGRKGEVEGPVLESTADSDGELAVKRVGRKGEVEGPILESTADSGGQLTVKRVGRKGEVEGPIPESSADSGGELSVKRVGRRGRGGRTGSGRKTSESSVGKKAIRSSRRIKKEPVQLESVVVQSQPGVGSSVSADMCDSVVEERREEGKMKKEGVDKDMEALREAVVELKHLDVVGIRHDKECMESERGKLKTVMKSGRPATVESTVEYQLTFHSDRNHTSRQEHLTGEEEAKPVQDEAQKPQTQTSQGRVVLQPKGEGVKHRPSNGEVMQQPGQEGEGIGLQPLQEEGNEMESEGVKHHLPQQVVDQQPVKEGERLGAPQEASMSAQNGLEASPTVRCVCVFDGTIERSEQGPAHYWNLGVPYIHSQMMNYFA